MDTELEYKPFNNIIINENSGNVECYKKDTIYKGKNHYDNSDVYRKEDCEFIIRTHPRGLITGLKIFKEWVES